MPCRLTTSLHSRRERSRRRRRCHAPQTGRTQKCVVLGPVGLFHSAVRRDPSVTLCFAAAILLPLPPRYCCWGGWRRDLRRRRREQDPQCSAGREQRGDLRCERYTGAGAGARALHSAARRVVKGALHVGCPQRQPWAIAYCCSSADQGMPSGVDVGERGRASGGAGRSVRGPRQD